MNLSNSSQFEANVHAELERLTTGVDEPLLIVGFSGGPDSTALMRVCNTFAKKKRGGAIAVHVNYGLRGAESDEDERFCEQWCEENLAGFVPCKFEASEKDEATLREARYLEFVRIAELLAKEHPPFIVTGHTLDDQVETLLFRLFRGTSPSGLVGIKDRRAVNERITIIRPLLNFRRAEVLSFLKEIGQSYRTDSTNLSSHYTRNYIRNEVLPRIAEKFGDIVPRVEQVRKMIAEEEVVFDELTETRAAAMFAENHACPLTAFLSLPKALQRRVIAEEMRERQIEVSSERVSTILELALNGGVITLNEEWRISVSNGSIQFVEVPDEESVVPISTAEHELQIGMNIFSEFGCAILLKDESQAPSQFPAAASDEAVIDLSSIKLPLIARKRRAGDTIVPFGMKERVKLKRYLQTHRRGDGSHAGHPLVIATNEEIIWVPGVGLSDVVRVRNLPTHRLEFMLLASDELPIA